MNNDNFCKNLPSCDDKEYIVNCAGEKVSIANAGFTSRCAIGNTDDYLETFKNYINSEIVSLGEPPLISVIIPSYASAENDFYQTLISLASQEYLVPTEILVFINEPKDAPESVLNINERNEKFIRFCCDIKSDITLDRTSSELLKIQQELLEILHKNTNNLVFRCVRQVMSGGLAGVYQTITASLIARVRTFCDFTMVNCDRQEKIKGIEKYLKHTMLLFCDDDMDIKDPKAIAKAHAQVVDHDAVVLGQIHIKQVDTAWTDSHILLELMQLFFDFKYDCGLNFLSPRGMLLADVLKLGGVKIGQPFADQLFFASAAKGKRLHLIEASTGIGESNYPGNGNFLKKLRLYLEGADNDALDIFENVLKRYQESNHNGKYHSTDIERLINNLKTRDIDKIASVTKELLKNYVRRYD